MERVDLLKMDIEGAEIDLLRSLPASELSQIRQITIEFHESSGLSTLDEVHDAIRRLEDAGFAAVKMSLTHYGDVLFLNKRLCGIGVANIAVLKYVTRSIVWARRAWERAVLR